MATRGELADEVDRLPAYRPQPQRRLSRVRLPFTRPRAPQGLEVVPERYRLQLLLLVAERLPEASQHMTVQVAGALGRETMSRVPSRLLDGDLDGLDRWFKENADAIRADLDVMAERRFLTVDALWRA